jgi:hypothetical protein
MLAEMPTAVPEPVAEAVAGVRPCMFCMLMKALHFGRELSVENGAELAAAGTLITLRI